MELHDKINSICDKLEYLSDNKEYANEQKYTINIMNNSANLESICVMEMLTEDNIEIKEKLNLNDEEKVQLEKFIDELDENEDVSDHYTNADF